MSDFEKLPEEISKAGFTYRLYCRKGKYAICEQYMKEVACPIPGEPKKNVLIGYEVIVIRKQKAQTFFGREYPAKEIYPGPESWGTFGFSFKNLKDAKNKFEYLISISDGRKKRLAS